MKQETGSSFKALPRVSICIIAYNQEEFIREAIDSALAQTYPNIEVVVADDGSEDGSVGVINEVAASAPDHLVALVGGPNLGITGNCNRALEASSGAYLVFMGGDDVLLPQKVQAQVEWLEQDPQRVLCGHELEVFYNGGERAPHLFGITHPSGVGPTWLIENGCPYGALAIMARRSSFPIGGFNSQMRYVSDHLFWIECLIGGGKFGFVDGVHGRYRRHSENITNKADTCLDDVASMFDHIDRVHPQYRESTRIGRWNLVDWPRGISLIRNGYIFAGVRALLKTGVRSPGRVFLALRSRWSRRKLMRP